MWRIRTESTTGRTCPATAKATARSSRRGPGPWPRPPPPVKRSGLDRGETLPPVFWDQRLVCRPRWAQATLSLIRSRDKNDPECFKGGGGREQVRARAGAGRVGMRASPTGQTGLQSVCRSGGIVGRCPVGSRVCGRSATSPGAVETRAYKTNMVAPTGFGRAGEVLPGPDRGRSPVPITHNCELMGVTGQGLWPRPEGVGGGPTRPLSDGRWISAWWR